MDLENKNKGQIVSLSDFKAKKSIKENLSKGRYPLYLSYLDKKIYSRPETNSTNEDIDFAIRLQRIKLSLERINKLMEELKKIAQSEEPTQDTSNVRILNKKKE